MYVHIYLQNERRHLESGRTKYPPREGTSKYLPGEGTLGDLDNHLPDVLIDLSPTLGCTAVDVVPGAATGTR